MLNGFTKMGTIKVLYLLVFARGNKNFCKKRKNTFSLWKSKKYKK